MPARGGVPGTQGLFIGLGPRRARIPEKPQAHPVVGIRRANGSPVKPDIQGRAGLHVGVEGVVSHQFEGIAEDQSHRHGRGVIPPGQVTLHPQEALAGEHPVLEFEAVLIQPPPDESLRVHHSIVAAIDPKAGVVGEHSGKRIGGFVLGSGVEVGVGVSPAQGRRAADGTRLEEDRAVPLHLGRVVVHQPPLPGDGAAIVVEQGRIHVTGVDEHGVAIPQARFEEANGPPVVVRGVARVEVEAIQGPSAERKQDGPQRVSHCFLGDGAEAGGYGQVEGRRIDEEVAGMIQGDEVREALDDEQRGEGVEDEQRGPFAGVQAPSSGAGGPQPPGVEEHHRQHGQPHLAGFHRLPESQGRPREPHHLAERRELPPGRDGRFGGLPEGDAQPGQVEQQRQEVPPGPSRKAHRGPSSEPAPGDEDV